MKILLISLLTAAAVLLGLYILAIGRDVMYTVASVGG